MNNYIPVLIIGSIAAIAAVVAFPYADRIARNNRRARSSVFSFRSPEDKSSDVLWVRFALAVFFVVGIASAILSIFHG